MAVSTGLYDLWRDDLRNGRYVYIRYFENLLQLLAGFQPEECGAAGVCSMQFLVESDGNVYPCDFFVEETYCLGNLHRDTLKDITKKLNSTDFIRSSWMLQKNAAFAPSFRSAVAAANNIGTKAVDISTVRRSVGSSATRWMT